MTAVGTVIFDAALFAAIFLAAPRQLLAISSNCFYLPNIAISGGTYDEFPSTEIKFCCMACARNPCCIAYTFDKAQNRCYMKSAISDSYKTSTMTSGIKANSHAGQGSMLKNIRIHGGTASAVRLSNSDDCMQYCTAYGIFSWSPLPKEQQASSSQLQPADSAASAPQLATVTVPALAGGVTTDTQPDGDCSCMSRISSLEYSFGSRSAIFPPMSNLN